MCIRCKACEEPIDSLSDLIVCRNWIFLQPFHAECYGRLTKTDKILALGNPINSFDGTMRAIFAPVVTIFFLFIVLSRVEIIYKNIDWGIGYSTGSRSNFKLHHVREKISLNLLAQAYPPTGLNKASSPLFIKSANKLSNTSWDVAIHYIRPHSSFIQSLNQLRR